LVDDMATTANGHLRHGVLDQLIKSVTRDGFTLSEREVQRRLQLALKYPTEEQIRQLMTEFEAWRDIVSSALPALPDVAAKEGERPYDPRTDTELRSSHDRHNPLPDGDQQLELFPRSSDDDTLADLRRYLEEMEELTARFAERDEQRRAYFNRLLKAVNGNEQATYGEARALLADQAATD
jgi:hypothetical protein